MGMPYIATPTDPAGTYILAYAWHDTSRKVARIPKGAIVEVIDTEGLDGWYEVEPFPWSDKGITWTPYPEAKESDLWFVDPKFLVLKEVAPVDPGSGEPPAVDPGEPGEAPDPIVIGDLTDAELVAAAKFILLCFKLAGGR